MTCNMTGCRDPKENRNGGLILTSVKIKHKHKRKHKKMNKRLQNTTQAITTLAHAKILGFMPPMRTKKQQFESVASLAEYSYSYIEKKVGNIFTKNELQFIISIIQHHSVWQVVTASTIPNMKEYFINVLKMPTNENASKIDIDALCEKFGEFDDLAVFLLVMFIAKETEFLVRHPQQEYTDIFLNKYAIHESADI